MSKKKKTALGYRMKENTDIRKVLELTRITITELSQSLGYTKEWVYRLLSNDLTKEHMIEILDELSALMETRRKEMTEAEKIMNELRSEGE